MHGTDGSECTDHKNQQLSVAFETYQAEHASECSVNTKTNN